MPTVFEDLSPRVAEVPIFENFDVRNYLAERACRTSFVMVEIGHDYAPVAYQQPAWNGQRRYVGLEGWLLDPDGEKRAHLDSLVAAHQNPNIQFVSFDLGGEVVATSGEKDGETFYSGDYEPLSVLPDAVADEVFLANVFGDPAVADSAERTQRLLSEVGRLLKDNGVVVVRETVTPQKANLSLSPESLDQTDLRTVAYRPYASRDWAKLEALYDGQHTVLFPKSANFYQFLKRQQTYR